MNESLGNWQGALLGRPGSFYFRPFRMAGCQAVSKADLMSRNAQQVMIFFFLLFSIRLVRERVAVSVEKPDLKPC